VNGVSVDFFNIRSWNLLKGSFFSAQDEHTNAKVVILGKTVADNLFADDDAVGKSVRVGNIPFKVIGVLASKGTTAGPGGDQDDAVYAPVTTVLNRMVGGKKNINSIVASAVSKEVISNAQEQITSLLRQTHQIRVNKPDDFSIMNQTEIISMAAETSQTFTMLLASIAAVSLIVGGIGIMNIMLVSVTERTREIGIRLSIGARSSDILTQFLVESMVLSMLGGCIGVISGIGIATLVLPIFNVSIAISPFVATGSFLFSGFVGIFFGFYPARRAASLNPIEALRYE
jgi:putative ABC transport system permease protein